MEGVCEYNSGYHINMRVNLIPLQWKVKGRNGGPVKHVSQEESFILFQQHWTRSEDCPGPTALLVQALPSAWDLL